MNSISVSRRSKSEGRKWQEEMIVWPQQRQSRIHHLDIAIDGENGALLVDTEVIKYQAGAYNRLSILLSRPNESVVRGEQVPSQQFSLRTILNSRFWNFEADSSTYLTCFEPRKKVFKCRLTSLPYLFEQLELDPYPQLLPAKLSTQMIRRANISAFALLEYTDYSRNETLRKLDNESNHSEYCFLHQFTLDTLSNVITAERSVNVNIVWSVQE